MPKTDYLYEAGLTVETDPWTEVIAIAIAENDSFLLTTVGKGPTDGISLTEEFDSEAELLDAMRSVQPDLRKWKQVVVEV